MLFILPQKLFAFLLYCKLRTIETYWNYAADHLLLLHIRLFSKTKSSLELVSLPHFVHDFWRKKLFLSYSNTWLRFTVSLPLLREVLSNTCIAIVCVFYCNCIMCIAINPLKTNVPITQKLIRWFALQINWLVFVWWEHRSLND